MDKNAIKKYAVWARRELISRVSQRAALYGITEDNTGDADADSVNGRVLSDTEREQRQALIAKIKSKGYEQVMEEAAYTWFNRFSALRFMEVNNYLPSRVRVFTDENNEFKPQILTEAINMSLDGLDMEKVYALKEANNNDELYKYLLITQCNALSSVLPGMFQKISDYTELLFPNNILREGSVIEQMITLIPEDDWKDAVQIIGWLYQYYNSEPKDKVFANLKKNIKVSKENIPAATQLFTPDWIVRYMVENSLGRLWAEGHKNSSLKSEWKYYLDEAEQEEEVKAQLDEIRKEYSKLEPTEIKCIDPCMGSGHILCYMFDVLMEIYEECGYSTRDAVKSIVENNLYGLDIDERAAQLAYFAVMMKARQYDKRFFSRGIQPNVYAIMQSNGLDSNSINYFCNDDDRLKNAMHTLIVELHDAKEYGAIIDVTDVGFEDLYARFVEINDDISIHKQIVKDQLLPFVKRAEVMVQKYDVVVTNPPYMSSSNMNNDLLKYVKEYYSDSKSDLFAVFIEKCGKFAKQNGYYAMITQHAFMFLSSYEKLRDKLLLQTTVNMAHLGARAFDEIGGEVVQTTAFVNYNSRIKDYTGTYVRLVDVNGEKEKENLFLGGENRYIAKQENFSKIPGSPVAYWVSENFTKMFDNPILQDLADAKKGISTSDNDRFLREWFEIAYTNIKFDCCSHDESKKIPEKWYPYNKGGEFRKWFGNNHYLINWRYDGIEISNFDKAIIRNPDYYFLESVTWTDLSSYKPSFRYNKGGFIHDCAGPCIFRMRNNVYYLMGLLNSNVTEKIFEVTSPTLHFNIGTTSEIPVIIDKEKSRLLTNS